MEKNDSSVTGENGTGTETETNTNTNTNTNTDTSNETKRKHQDVCVALLVDREIGERAWTAYKSLDDTYSLAGQPVHWIGLSIYAECIQNLHKFSKRKSDDDQLEGNQISFSKILQLCDLNASDFFAKMKNWIEMTTVSDFFIKSIDKLERNFYVTVVLFKKLRKIFYNIFIPIDGAKMSKTKIKSNLCTSSSLFEFCWYLFICMKGEFKEQSDDLVNMYHVLLGCIDLVFSNAYAAQRKDIIDPKFNALPPNWTSSKTKSSDPPCIISYFCDKSVVSAVDAKKMKEYDLKVKLEKFLNEEFLKGDKIKFLNLIDPINFNFNLKSLSRIYGSHILAIGEFDERILLVDRETGSKFNEIEITKAISSYEMATSVPSTPLTGRQYLNNKNNNLTPVTMASQPSIKLQEYLLGHSNSPSAILKNLLIKYQENLIEIIVNRQKEMAVQFLAAYSKLFPEDITGYRLTLIEVLYYKLLEQILTDEQMKNPSIDIKKFNYEMFHKTLFVISTEIVIFVSQPAIPRFPWVLDCYALEPFNLFKIIELVVLAVRERLSREVIKHLSIIEENILDSLAWKSESPLWETILSLKEPIPQYCNVKIAENISVIQQNGNAPSNYADTSDSSNDVLTKSQLFKDASIKPGQSLLSQNNSTGESSDSVPGTSRKKQVKAGSIGVFFRKFYHLSYTRLLNLCDNLRIKDEEFIKKIWTCFEHGIIQQTHLMKDRHLDQILMCTVYGMCKISHDENNPNSSVGKSFMEIMRCYRLQPQAKNHIYRDVFLTKSSPRSCNENISPESSRRGNVSVRGDLIEFYNTIFVQSMERLITAFSGRRSDSERSNVPETIACKLSPFPEIYRSNGLSPGAHRVYENHRLFVSSLNASSAINDASQQARFTCSSKDLQHINSLMCTEAKITLKRPLPFTDGTGIIVKKISRKFDFK